MNGSNSRKKNAKKKNKVERDALKSDFPPILLTKIENFFVILRSGKRPHSLSGSNSNNYKVKNHLTKTQISKNNDQNWN